MAGAHDITKLPRWAQDRIGKLERDLAAERRKLSAGPENSDTFADPYASAPRPLGRHTRIQFVGERDEFHVHIDDDGELTVHTLTGRLLAMSGAANVMRFKSEQF